MYILAWVVLSVMRCVGSELERAVEMLSLHAGVRVHIATGLGSGLGSEEV